jgi:hypothetical protein
MVVDGKAMIGDLGFSQLVVLEGGIVVLQRGKFVNRRFGSI